MQVWGKQATPSGKTGANPADRECTRGHAGIPLLWSRKAMTLKIAGMSGSVVQFGAGSIGRGFTAQLFADAGLEVVFVDVSEAIVAELRERGAYPIHLVGPRVHATHWVHGVRAVGARDADAVAEELACAELVCTAVGVAALPRVAPALAAGLRLRARRGAGPLNVILCENQMGAAAILREAVRAHLPAEEAALPDGTGFVESVVSRMVPVPEGDAGAADPLAVRCEDYATLPVDADGFIGAIPAIPGLVPCRPFRAQFERKLYGHNLGHAVAAYHGYQRDCQYIHEAMADEGLLAATRAALEEAGRGLTARHAFGAEEQQSYNEDLLLRFANAELRDTVARVGRDPLRKLRREDRLVGAGMLAIEHGIEPRAIADGIAAALRYDAAEDESAVALQRQLAATGLDGVLEQVCGLEPGSPLTTMVRAAYVVMGAHK